MMTDASVVPPSWCQVLGLPDPGTLDDARRVYRALAQQHHPDRGGDASEFRRVEEAYRCGRDHPRISVTGGRLLPMPNGWSGFVRDAGATTATIAVDGPIAELAVVRGDLPEVTLRATRGGKLAVNACRRMAGVIIVVDAESAIELRGNVAIQNGRTNGVHVPPGKACGPTFHVAITVPRDVKVEKLPNGAGLRFTRG
jgi:DnaJ domain